MNTYFYTLGCKVNQYETEALKQLFFDSGYVISDDPDSSDVFVLNSCTVTSVSDKKSKQHIRKFKKINPDGIVALIGCFPQAFPEESAKVLEADIIMGTSNKTNLINNINKFLETKKQIIDINPILKSDGFEKMSIKNFSDKTRAFIKIQDGCNRLCSYCIIPKSRGHLRSKSLDDIKNEVYELSQAGYKEFVLVGINLCFYGEDSELTIVDAIKTVASVDLVERIRLGSLEPEKITHKEISELKKIDKFCPQFHLSLQSGDDSVLNRMQRHYNTDEYFNILSSLKENFENASFTTDIIIGFPGETEDEFNNTIKFAEKCQFSKVHTFPFSKRQGTKAADMNNQVDNYIKSVRTKDSIKNFNKLTEKFFETQLNKTCSVLIEKEIEDNIFEGYSENYTPVRISSKTNILGEIVNVKIESFTEKYCIGII
ncbi:MAG: tRNA (N(6)-L-threonylcarbamoyladenosine(37)-C(2))-methylthiotransferase MtaB [Oscillospiraceae bacterium]